MQTKNDDNKPSGAPPVSVTCAGCGAFSYPGDRYCACCGRELLRRPDELPPVEEQQEDR